MMKRFFILLISALLCVEFSYAQKMTDEQVIEYVVEAQAKGSNQQQIASDLLRRGVTMDQVNRIRRKMETQEQSGLGMTLEKKSRIRTAPQENGAIKLQQTEGTQFKDASKDEMMGDDIGFLFPDSATMQIAMKEEENRKKIFGHRIFQNKEIAFEAAYNLPTPPNYKLGPGDEVAIDIWGASESSIQDVISPETLKKETDFLSFLPVMLLYTKISG